MFSFGNSQFLKGKITRHHSNGISIFVVVTIVELKRGEQLWQRSIVLQTKVAKIAFGKASEF